MSKPVKRIHPEEAYLLKKKDELKATLEFMKSESLKASKNGDPNWDYYVVAVGSITRELMQITKKLL